MLKHWAEITKAQSQVEGLLQGLEIPKEAVAVVVVAMVWG